MKININFNHNIKNLLQEIRKKEHFSAPKQINFWYLDIDTKVKPYEYKKENYSSIQFPLVYQVISQKPNIAPYYIFCPHFKIYISNLESANLFKRSFDFRFKSTNIAKYLTSNNLILRKITNKVKFKEPDYTLDCNTNYYYSYYEFNEHYKSKNLKAISLPFIKNGNSLLIDNGKNIIYNLVNINIYNFSKDIIDQKIKHCLAFPENNSPQISKYFKVMVSIYNDDMKKFYRVVPLINYDNDLSKGNIFSSYLPIRTYEEGLLLLKHFHNIRKNYLKLVNLLKEKNAWYTKGYIYYKLNSIVFEFLNGGIFLDPDENMERIRKGYKLSFEEREKLIPKLIEKISQGENIKLTKLDELI